VRRPTELAEREGALDLLGDAHLVAQAHQARADGASDSSGAEHR
jgi:hypothetical protein